MGDITERIPLRIGTTLSRYEDASTSTSYGKWTDLSADTFMLRVGPDYTLNKRKSPSEAPLYTVIHADVYETPSKIPNISRFFDLSSLTPPTSPDILPNTLVINVMCPLYSPGLLTDKSDGRGMQVLLFCVRNPAAGTAAEELFGRFIAGSDDKIMRSRLKAIARVANVDELNLGWVIGALVKKYNSTPFLVHKHESEVYAADNCLEISVDMHRFGKLCRQGFYSLQGIFKSIKADFGFVIEGRENSELPEAILACFQCSEIENLKAKPFPFQAP